MISRRGFLKAVGLFTAGFFAGGWRWNPFRRKRVGLPSHLDPAGRFDGKEVVVTAARFYLPRPEQVLGAVEAVQYGHVRNEFDVVGEVLDADGNFVTEVEPLSTMTLKREVAGWDKGQVPLLHYEWVVLTHWKGALA